MISGLIDLKPRQIVTQIPRAFEESKKPGGKPYYGGLYMEDKVTSHWGAAARLHVGAGDSKTENYM